MIRYIWLFILLFINNSIFPISPIREEIIIRNNTSKVLIITREYHDEPSRFFYAPETHAWQQNFYGMILNFQDIYLGRKEINVLPHGGERTLIFYDPGHLPELDLIIIIDKIRSIYKSLTITTEDGKIVITLENLENHIIKKNKTRMGTSYIIEIFEYDLERIPVLEW